MFTHHCHHNESLFQITKNKSLIVIPAGADSCHKNWHQFADRTYDIAVISFDPNSYKDNKKHSDYCFPQEGAKFALLDSFFSNQPEIWKKYEFFWLPDDDLQCSGETVNRLFDIFIKNKMPLAQPSLTQDSPVSHGLTTHRRPFIFRETNFVEVMAPVFTKQSLQKAVPLFLISRSGWGIDEIWSQLTFADEKKFIIDAVQVKHMRPPNSPKPGEDVASGGGFYAKLGVNPHTELMALSKKYDFIVGLKKLSVSGELLGGIPTGKFITHLLVKADKKIARFQRRISRPRNTPGSC
ncbi:hypothetical protein [Candidatus Pelagisphaera phototrophica]|uniref:hypothetical protein n=1 Tax=Candidatus Pelagisphaera phototrophica TaxID=2684113 RepID=UPI0019DE0891|nr:hypothetical protein [Candidatus Pelagisphaera phototrophica]QXD32158.1 hypothetical protein GA004_00040 [Candidatus Pelagisphaera phototrophica]